MAHPSSLRAVPPGAGESSGVTGLLSGTQPDGPTQLLKVMVGTRQLLARWAWEGNIPAVGAQVALAVRADTLRFYAVSSQPVLSTGT